MNKTIISVSGIILSVLLLSCEQNPTLADQTTTAVEDASDFESRINGTYELMSDYHYYGRNYIIGVGEVRADNVYSNRHTTRFGDYSVMDVSPDPDRDDDYIFDQLYASVANPNLIINSDIEEIVGASELDSEIDDIHHIVGQAYTLRALIYFDLLRGWGEQYSGGTNGISYVKEFKPDDLNIPRGSIDSNRSDLNLDIDNAIEYLKLGAASKHEDSKTNITLDAARALKYRIAVYFKEYEILRQDAQEIESLIERYAITPAEDVVKYWSQNEPGEASIFELYLSESESNGGSNIGAIYRGANNLGDIQAFDDLIDDADFDENDVRAQPAMIDQDSDGALRNRGKYPDNKNGSDNIKVFRIEEIILNYAEALVESEPSKALHYLNLIPKHRDSKVYSSNASDNLYLDILKERRKEFMFEGFRFFDLARFELPIRQIDSAVLTHEEIPPGDNRLALPIPTQEMDANSEAVQNEGY